MLLAVHPSVPAKSVKELIALAKRTSEAQLLVLRHRRQQPFLGRAVRCRRGIKPVHVPYKGIAPAVTALASGEVEW